MGYTKKSSKVLDIDRLFESAPYKSEIRLPDVLDHMLDCLVTLSDFSEFAASEPEMVLTISEQVYAELQASQDYGYMKASKTGTTADGYKYMVFILSTAGGGQLIVQEGPRTSTLENIQ
jgi:hypothetical protein